MTDRSTADKPTRAAPGVLVAEDQPDLRHMLCLALAGAGFRVWAAADGDEAVRFHREHRGEIDVALLDVTMPGKDGPAALAELRALDPALPCCLMSGWTDAETTAELLALGASCVFAKPFDLPELFGVLGRLCGRPAEVDDAPCVLIVDDDAVTRAAVTLVLRRAGYETAEAANGRQALHYLRSRQLPRLVLLDLLMPVMDGWEFLAERWKEPTLAAVPVLVLSVACGIDAPAVQVMGADDILYKPADPEELLEAVGRYC
jgi:CheY-like chemotaxis protein